MERNNRENNGFTLIELVIVVAVLAILVGLLAPSYTKYVKKSKVTKCEAQRDEIERVYQIACIEDDELAGLTSLDSNTSINGMKPIKYLASLGYFNENEAICPVYKENYIMDVNNNIALVICPCVDTVLNYIDTSVKIFNESFDKWREQNGNYYDRAWLITEFYNKFGGLPEVSNSMKKGTKYENIDTPLYWRPYNYTYDKEKKTVDPSTVILYACDDKNNGTGNWKAGLLYINGKIYEAPGSATNAQGKLEFKFNVADLGLIGNKNQPKTLEEWIKQKNLREIG